MFPVKHDWIFILQTLSMTLPSSPEGSFRRSVSKGRRCYAELNLAEHGRAVGAIGGIADDLLKHGLAHIFGAMECDAEREGAGLRQDRGSATRSFCSSTLPAQRGAPLRISAKPWPHWPGLENRAAIPSA